MKPMAAPKSIDLLVALKAHLWAEPGPWSFARLGATVGLSASQAHAAFRRLAASGLYRPADRSLRVHAFVLFAAHGVPHVFPAPIGPTAVGMPTAHAAPPLRSQLVHAEAYVWPGEGRVPGRAVPPLHPSAPAAAAADADLYAALALIDAFRVGRVRERQLAVPAMPDLLERPARDRSWTAARRPG